jgi:hypothetical protein
MIRRAVIGSMIGATLMASPLTALAIPRETAPVEGEQLRGSPLLAIVAVFAILSAILLLSAGSDDEPISP